MMINDSINNDSLRKLRYILNYSDAQMIETFALGKLEVKRKEVSSWLKNQEDADYLLCDDHHFCAFLDGLIIARRGPPVKEGDSQVVNSNIKLSNNIILRKLMIAFSLKSDDILALLELADFRLSKNELSAFFRKKEHRNYRECKDQILRNFLHGLQVKLCPKD